MDALRDACPEVVSLVAVEGDRVLGHILFSPVSVARGQDVTGGMGLAPMAVLPERQRQGIGSMLVQAGIAAIRERRCPFRRSWPPGVLSPFRVRAGVESRPLVPVGRRALRGVDGAGARRMRHGGRIWRCALPR